MTENLILVLPRIGYTIIKDNNTDLCLPLHKNFQTMRISLNASSYGNQYTIYCVTCEKGSKLSRNMISNSRTVELIIPN